MKKSFPTNHSKKRIYPFKPLTLCLTYLLLAIILTWPTVTQFSTHLPGDGGDDPAIAWNLWWIKQALLTEGQNPFQTDYMFYPIGINLAFYTLTVLNGVTALPFTLNFDVVAASNLHMLFSFVVGAYGTFLLSYSVLKRVQPEADRQLLWLSAACAGGFYAFASSKLFYIALGQFNIGSTHWIPFTVLYILRMTQAPHRLKNAFMAGLFLTFQAWTEMTYASFLIVFIGLYWLYTFILRRPQSRTVLNLRVYTTSVLLLGVTFTLGLAPILAQMLPDMWVEGDFFVVGSGFAEAFSADLVGFILPTMHHPFLGDLIRQSQIVAFDKGQHIYIGVVLLGLVLVNLRAILHQSSLRFWLIASFIFALLCLGPIVIINGQNTGIGGPFVIFQQLPFFRGNRYPSRYSVMLMLSLSVLASFGLVQISRWLTASRRYALISLIAVLFVFEHLSLPLPQSDMRVPEPYQMIAQDQSNFTVLDIPFAWRNGFRITGALTTQFMFGQFYQTQHQKPMLQGNTSRNPEFKFQYFTDAPVINSLLTLQTGKDLPPERWEADRAIGANVLRFFNIKYIVVRPDPTDSLIVRPQATIPYIEDVFPVEKIHDDGAVIIYQVIQTPIKPITKIDANHPLASLYFGEGWGAITPNNPITAQRYRTRLLLPLSSSEQQITLRLSLPEIDTSIAQTVSISLNGWQSSSQTVSNDWAEYRFQIPGGIANKGLNDVWLHFNDLISASSDIHPIDVTVLSAGEEVGGFGHIFVNGHDISPNERGYNVITVIVTDQPEVATFDTHLDALASPQLANFINQSIPESFIATAAADEASQNLGEEAVSAFQAIGSTIDPRGCFRCSHALIHTIDGQIHEAFDPLRPVAVTTGLGLTEPNIAAVVEWIKIEAGGE